jgi:ABC-2 type transport system permease protein
MALFADGGLLLNKVNRSAREPKILPLGYDRVSKITYGNRDFFVNLVQYLGDDASLSALKNKSWQIRLLDKVKVREQDSYLPWLNLLVPLFLILAGGVMFAWFRKRRNEK